MTRLEESRDTLKELHSTLQDPSLLWKRHVLSPVSTALRKISTDHQRIQSQSDPSLLAHCFQRKDCTRNKLEIQRTPTETTQKPNIHHQVGKTTWREICGWARVILPVPFKGFVKLTPYVTWNLTRKTPSRCYPDHIQKPKILSLVHSWHWPHIMHSFDDNLLQRLIHFLLTHVIDFLFLRENPKGSGNFA